MHINTCIDKMLPLVESRGSDVDICDKASPDILQQIPTLTVVFGSGGHHLRKCGLLISSRPSPNFFFRLSPKFFPHRYCRNQNAGFWLAAFWCRRGHSISPTILLPMFVQWEIIYFTPTTYKITTSIDWNNSWVDWVGQARVTCRIYD